MTSIFVPGDDPVEMGPTRAGGSEVKTQRVGITSHEFSNRYEIRQRISELAESKACENAARKNTDIMGQSGAMTQGLVDGGQIELGIAMTGYDMLRFLAPWAALGLGIGAAITIVIIELA